ncbi:hypothetical protein DW905_04045 [Faecalibacterium prausnitzii]|uniref:Uncharacterized protein n=1 Tax=Faecalibacterium prausnitzii TaxID=853 RepID=A0A3E2V7D3_9FIRM|nr:hypothetical protein DW905_04045 [Faecalibacterium prausnitzii]RGC35719.1 hypothetical protein DW882_01315 [Faecalibacterium prausnitzii]
MYVCGLLRAGLISHLKKLPVAIREDRYLHAVAFLCVNCADNMYDLLMVISRHRIFVIVHMKKAKIVRSVHLVREETIPMWLVNMNFLSELSILQARAFHLSWDWLRFQENF